MSETPDNTLKRAALDEIEQQRQQLAEDLGYLLARYWLEQFVPSPLPRTTPAPPSEKNER